MIKQLCIVCSCNNINVCIIIISVKEHAKSCTSMTMHDMESTTIVLVRTHIHFTNSLVCFSVDSERRTSYVGTYKFFFRFFFLETLSKTNRNNNIKYSLNVLLLLSLLLPPLLILIWCVVAAGLFGWLVGWCSTIFMYCCCSGYCVSTALKTTMNEIKKKEKEWNNIEKTTQQKIAYVLLYLFLVKNHWIVGVVVVAGHTFIQKTKCIYKRFYVKNTRINKKMFFCHFANEKKNRYKKLKNDNEWLCFGFCMRACVCVWILHTFVRLI